MRFDFLSTTYEPTLLLVNATIDRIGRCFLTHLGASVWTKNADCEAGEPRLSHNLFLIALKESPWTIALYPDTRLSFDFVQRHQDHHAEQLSKRLRSETIILSGTSEGGRFVHHENGKRTTSATIDHSGKLLTFESSGRQKPRSCRSVVATFHRLLDPHSDLVVPPIEFDDSDEVLIAVFDDTDQEAEYVERIDHLGFDPSPQQQLLIEAIQRRDLKGIHAAIEKGAVLPIDNNPEDLIPGLGTREGTQTDNRGHSDAGGPRHLPRQAEPRLLRAHLSRLSQWLP